MEHLFTMKVNESSLKSADEFYFHVYMMHLVKYAPYGAQLNLSAVLFTMKVNESSIVVYSRRNL